MEPTVIGATYAADVTTALAEVQGVLTANAGALLLVTAAFVGFKVVKRLIKGIS